MSPDALVLPFVAQAADRVDRPLVIGLCGAQGSGKSTLAALLCERLPGTVSLSLDDLYHTRAERMELAGTVHPLLRTRGVPGTHDVELGLAVLDGIRDRRAVRLPRFSKAMDDRLPESEWELVPADTRIVILEGWCVGAVPQTDDRLLAPINVLEREHDPDRVWRRFVNAALAGPYQTLFARLDHLILLGAPNWEQVLTWRIQQEDTLRRSGAQGDGLMDRAALQIFVSHYERLTRHILTEMPGRCDLFVGLDQDRRVAQDGPTHDAIG